MSVSAAPHPWQALHAVAAALAKSPDSTTAHHAYRAVSIPVRDWPVEAAAWIHGTATGPARSWLEDQGWDPGMLPDPTAATASAPVSTRIVLETDQNRADGLPGCRVKIPVGYDANKRMRSVPQATWDGAEVLWRVPITQPSAAALRHVLTGENVTVHPDVRDMLSTAANQPPPAHVTMSNNSQQVIVSTHGDTVLEGHASRELTGFTKKGQAGWFAPANQAPAAVRFADKHNLGVTDQVRVQADRLTAPLEYDGTIDGLRGVPLTDLACVSADLAARFGKFGVTNIFELLSVVPRRYIDRASQVKIRDLVAGMDAALIGTIKATTVNKEKRYVRFTIVDGTGELAVTFFRSMWMTKKYRDGQQVVLHGRVDVWRPKNGGRVVVSMANPVMDPLGDDTAVVVPVYPQSEKKSKITTWDVHRACMEAVSRLGQLTDPLPRTAVLTRSLVPRVQAYEQVHRPDNVEAALHGRHRLAYDELFRIQLALGMSKHANKDATGVQHTPTGHLVSQLHNQLPYPLTGAQTRVLTEIKTDLASPSPMHRLLQGDVGAGKSVVAMSALLHAVEGGHQGALMAPTEILASQLFTELAERLVGITRPDGTPVTVRFLAAKTRVKERREILAGLLDGTIDVVVGTHALILDDVQFRSLGLVVVDEQHRFGVEQRAALAGKNSAGRPDMLAMTATPIPRTAAMTLFGDLDVSVLDEMPPGRTPIATAWVDEKPDLNVLTGPPWDQVRAQVEEGRQAYVVTSLVEDNEKLDAASAEETFAALQDGALNGLRLGLVHGQQKRDVRDSTMAAFKAGELDVIVATTVIEVGVNVPNATVIVILDAPRFGIAQLHQLRGRVGRGEHASSCVLVGEASSADSRARMEALCESTDGFYLSEVDLDLRGEGSILGATAKQAGMSDLRVASLRDDRDLVPLVRADAAEVLAEDPKLARQPVLRSEVKAALGADTLAWLQKS